MVGPWKRSTSSTFYGHGGGRVQGFSNTPHDSRRTTGRVLHPRFYLRGETGNSILAIINYVLLFQFNPPLMLDEVQSLVCTPRTSVCFNFIVLPRKSLYSGVLKSPASGPLLHYYVSLSLLFLSVFRVIIHVCGVSYTCLCRRVSVTTSSFYTRPRFPLLSLLHVLGPEVLRSFTRFPDQFVCPLHEVDLTQDRRGKKNLSRERRPETDRSHYRFRGNKF